MRHQSLCPLAPKMELQRPLNIRHPAWSPVPCCRRARFVAHGCQQQPPQSRPNFGHVFLQDCRGSLAVAAQISWLYGVAVSGPAPLLSLADFRQHQQFPARLPVSSMSQVRPMPVCEGPVSPAPGRSGSAGLAKSRLVDGAHRPKSGRRALSNDSWAWAPFNSTLFS